MRLIIFTLLTLRLLYGQPQPTGSVLLGSAITPQSWTSGGQTTVSSASSASITNITAPSNSVVVLEATVNLSSGVSGTFNSVACSADGGPTETGAAGYYLYEFSCGINATGGATATAEISWTGSKNAAFQVAILNTSKVISGSQGPDVKGQCAESSSGQPSVALGASGTTCTGSTSTSLANEICLGVFINPDATIGGTWSNSFTDGQHESTGSASTIDDGWKLLSATQTVTAAKTSATSAEYADFLGCYEHI